VGLDLLYHRKPSVETLGYCHKNVASLGKSLFALSGIQPKMRDCAVQVEANATARNRLDGEVRTLDKGSAGKSIDPKEGATYSS
jgi:hypothetical protein